MLIRCIALLGVLSCLLSPAAVLADEGEGLGDMLERVPGVAMVDGSPVSYVDYRAVESARPGAARPESTTEWVALRETGGAPFSLWLAAIRGVSSGSGHFLDAFVAGGEDQRALMGFDFFDVDRGLHFGEPPQDGLVLAGAFDPQDIATAHAARAFTVTDATDWMLICGAAGCDQGTSVDLQAVERADPFGGSLGRRQPLLASDGILLSSATLGTLEAMRAASDGAVPSLADDAMVRMVLDVIPDDVLLRQAMFVPPELLIADVGALIPGAVFNEQEAQEHLDPLALDPIPPYRLGLLADTATPEEQVVHVVLAYASKEGAQAAAAVLPSRVEAGRSIRADRTLRELLDGRGVTAIWTSVHTDPHGSGAAAVLTLRAPLASPDVTDGPPEASSLLYRLLVDMVLSRDAPWLAPSILPGVRAD